MLRGPLEQQALPALPQALPEQRALLERVLLLGQMVAKVPAY